MSVVSGRFDSLWGDTVQSFSSDGIRVVFSSSASGDAQEIWIAWRGTDIKARSVGDW
jgi:WD40-like Beta Propeller Repeat